MTPAPPRPSAFTPAEHALIRRLDTPARVQAFLNGLPYNDERGPEGKTLRSFRGVIQRKIAHCLEAALAAAVILEQHGYPPLVLSFESVDKLEHVIFAYRSRGRWGSVSRSRDPGLHGRKPVFRTARALAMSYFEPYVDLTGCITAYAVVDLGKELGAYDWRLSEKNIWKAEQMLIDFPHRRIRMDRKRAARWRAWYRAFKARYPDRKPVRYPGREAWTALPGVFTKPGYQVDFPWPPRTRRARPSRDRSRASAS